MSLKPKLKKQFKYLAQKMKWWVTYKLIYVPDIDQVLLHGLHWKVTLEIIDSFVN
jgi:hypothetical protein